VAVIAFCGMAVFGRAAANDCIDPHYERGFMKISV
jgi:hypothetical protein